MPLEQIVQVSVPSINSLANSNVDDIDEESQEESNIVTASLEVSKEESSTSEEENAEMTKESVTLIKYDSRNKCYYTSLHVPLPQLGSVIGFKNSNKQKLEKATNCKLKVDSVTGMIEVSADSSDSVRKCKDKILALLDGGNSKPRPTHFVSVELSNKVLQKSYSELVENIRTGESTSEHCREESLFRPIEKLHLTISVLRLMTEEEKEVVKRCIDKLFQNEIREMLKQEHQIPVHFDGLDFFGSGPSKANVIYAKIVSDRLQKIANVIDDSLFETGLAEKRRTKDVKLHLTLINTKNAKKGFKNRKINATALLKKYANFKFDSVMANEVRICSMVGVDPATNGHQAIHSVKF